jgi:predicted membrane protein
MRKQLVRKLAIWLGVLASTSLSAASAADTITTFDAPGVGTLPGTGTVAQAINGSGVVTGYYIDNNLVYHGFVRASNGTMTTFDANGAGFNTQAVAINNAGTVAGTAYNSVNSGTAFLRASNGTITTFTISGAALFGVEALSINDAGTVAGYWVDANDVNHGFVRTADGTITSFDVPGAGTSADEGTFGNGINASGTVTGLWVDAADLYHGFLRTSNGTFTSFDVPGLIAGPGQGTYPVSINASGVVTGEYFGSNVAGFNDFSRAADGTFTTFLPDGSGGASFVNASGGVVGYQGSEGFVRTATGKIGLFEVDRDATVAVQMNASYVVTGYYTDSSRLAHGFLLTP